MQEETNLDTSPLESIRSLEAINALPAQRIYSSLQPDEIRLVKIHQGLPSAQIECSLVLVSLRSSPKYESLSYVWGPHDESRTITLCREKYSITSNLYNALVHLRLATENRLVWIDALAINQNNLPELNTQVQHMRHIYGAAEGVLIWLGSGDRQIEQLFDFINDRGEDWRYSYGSFEDELTWASNQSFVISSIANLPYWERVWVVQEIMHSPHGSLVYGHSMVRYSRFMSFWEIVTNRVTKTLATDEFMHNYRLFKADTSAVDNFKVISPGSAMAGRFIDLPTWLDKYSKFKCSDPHDIIFGFLGCFEPDIAESIMVDYAMPVVDLYTQMTRLLIEATGNLEVCAVATTRVYPLKGLPLTQVPSWVPNFAGKASAALEERLPDEIVTQLLPHGPTFFQFEGDGKILHLRGITIGEIQRTTSSDPFEDIDIDQASSLDLQTGFRTKIWHIRRELEVSYIELPSFIATFSSWAEQHARCGEILHDVLEEPKELDLAMHQKFKSWLSVFRFTTRRMIFYKLTTQTNSLDESNSMFFGKCSMEVTPGDILCWMFASPFLLALRKVDNHHILVGSANTAGLLTTEFLSRMFGEPAEDFFVQ